MISKEAFAKRCATIIKEKTPFIAYWHPNGTGLLILDGGERTEYTIEYKYGRGGKVSTAKETTIDPKRKEVLLGCGGKLVKEKTIHMKPMASTVNGFHRAIQKMWRKIWDLCEVEYDGYSCKADGDGLQELIEGFVS